MKRRSFRRDVIGTTTEYSGFGRRMLASIERQAPERRERHKRDRHQRDAPHPHRGQRPRGPGHCQREVGEGDDHQDRLNARIGDGFDQGVLPGSASEQRKDERDDRDRTQRQLGRNSTAEGKPAGGSQERRT